MFLKLPSKNIIGPSRIYVRYLFFFLESLSILLLFDPNLLKLPLSNVRKVHKGKIFLHLNRKIHDKSFIQTPQAITVLFDFLILFISNLPTEIPLCL